MNEDAKVLVMLVLCPAALGLGVGIAAVIIGLLMDAGEKLSRRKP